VAQSQHGAIELHYLHSIAGADKPSPAGKFCEEVSTRDALLACCGTQQFTRNDDAMEMPEFTLIIEGIFSETVG
jgi:hypothetical protein